MPGATMTAAGLSIQTIDQIRDELAAALQTAFGPSIKAKTAKAVAGALVQAIAEVDSLEQEAILAVYQAFTLDGAEGVSLDRLVAIGGLTRKPATQSLVDVTLTPPAGPAVNVPQGALIENTATHDLFAVVSAVVVPGGTPTAAVLRAVSTGSVPVPLGASWAWISAFVGSATLGVTNAADGTEGDSEESDASLRLRFLASYHAPGSGTLASILANTLAVAGVQGDARAFENVELATGITAPEIVSTLPGKSFVVVERGGANADVAAAVFTRKPAGIKAHGSTVVMVTDGEGFQHAIGIEVAAVVTVHIELTITGGDAANEAAVKAAVQAYGDTLQIGSDVIALRVISAALAVAGANVTDVTAKIDVIDPPIAVGNLSVDWNKRASVVAANVDIVFV
jgi:uncharacterized phage protein gp47/JayE